MSTNLVLLVMQYLTPDVIAKIASTLGLGRDSAQKAVGASVPALLAGLAGVASKSGGARKLFDAVAQQQPGLLSSLASAIGGAGQPALVDKGSSVLSSLLGGPTLAALTGAVGKFAGLGEGSSSSLLGLLGSVVMGALGEQRSSTGLDASGLANLLTSQKAQIAAALPPGFANLISGTSLLDGLEGAVNKVAAGATQSASQTVQRTTSVESPYRWLYWAIPVLVLAVLAAWYFLGQRGHEVAEQPRMATPAAQGLTVNGVDLGAQVTTTVNNLKTTLQGITDTASAQAALPKLQDAATQFDKVSGTLAQLSQGQKAILAGLITAAMPTLNQLFDRVLGIPGVSDIAKPAIDGLRANLDKLAKA